MGPGAGRQRGEAATVVRVAEAEIGPDLRMRVQALLEATLGIARAADTGALMV